MKKLMVAASVAICAAAGFALESANVVGYAKNALPEGYSMITPCFETVGGGEYPIDNLLLNNVPDCDANLQVVNADGSWGTMCFWFNAWGDLPAGWFADADGTIPANIQLKPGQSVFFYTKAIGASAQSAGQIPGVITLDLDTGYSMIGNGSPVPVAIDDILLENVADCDANLQVVNPDGSWGTMCFWFNAWGDLPAGWFADADGTIPAGITLQPGQSVFFYTKASGAKVSIPSALAE